MFGIEFRWSRKRLMWFVQFLVGIVAIALGGSYFGWHKVGPWLKENENALKLVGYLVGPALALIGFVLGVKDKLDLVEGAEKLGALRQEAAAAEKRAKAAELQATEEKKGALKLKGELETVTKGADQLWKLRPPRPFKEYRGWYFDTNGAKTVAIGNLKGGVGKTTIAANFAAYVSEVLRKRVLIVDLDYQGSLSTMLMRAVGRTETASRIDTLFSPGANWETLQEARVHLVPQLANHPTSMAQAWLVQSGYELNRLENQLLFDWLMDEQQSVDVRYRLAHALLSPSVRRDYDLIIFDLPPRLTLGTINALVASHHLFIPTILDGLSVDAVPQLLTQVSSIKRDLDLGVEFGGVIGTLTQEDSRSARENFFLGRAQELSDAAWPLRTCPSVLDRSIPRRAAFSAVAGEDVALLRTGDQNNLGGILHTLFKDMAGRIGLD